MIKIKIALLWCGVAKALETFSMTLGHLWQGFLLIPKIIEIWKQN